ncbi:hypothetical protein E3E26_07810 [Thermococcus sp. LS1]|uniref:hypothetical protein n=1 Tax=Thermococcus sp. LS1 TaxID=1638259 RepID=UPI0014391194|nr:hypothetical protein [Thermococcus sp. LS1]NJD99685.1 hypothetical protein [Thermococcus sp. LS1]
MPWKLYRFKYKDYPEYSARITSHYAGDVLIIEEEGKISEEAVRIIKESFRLSEGVKGFDIEVKDIMKLPIGDLPEADREILLQAAEKLDSESKLHIEYHCQLSFD